MLFNLTPKTEKSLSTVPVSRNVNVLLCILILLKLETIFFFRFHIMSRDDRLGSGYSSDLYLRSWELERESSHRNLGLTESHLGHQENQKVHQKYQHDFRYPSDSTACVSTYNELITGRKISETSQITKVISIQY